MMVDTNFQIAYPSRIGGISYGEQAILANVGGHIG